MKECTKKAKKFPESGKQEESEERNGYREGGKRGKETSISTWCNSNSEKPFAEYYSMELQQS